MKSANHHGGESTPQKYRINGDESMHSFRVDTCLRRLNVSLLAFIASAVIAFPSYSVASSPLTDLEIYRAGTSTSSSIILTEADLSSIASKSITELGLKPPTEDKPQITLNGRAQEPTQQSMPNKANARVPILQGLVYFPERAPADPNAKMPSGPQVKQQLDYYSDILVLTAVSAAQPDGPVLAGAKFPVSAVRFPFSFQMFKENLLTSRPGVQEAWVSVAKTGDVIIRASICPSDARAFPCDDSESKKDAEGVAKLITNLPGLKDGESVRAPASLALQ